MVDPVAITPCPDFPPHPMPLASDRPLLPGSEAKSARNKRGRTADQSQHLDRHFETCDRDPQVSIPCFGKLVMSTMVYADEVVDVDKIEELEGLDAVDVSDKEVRMAEALVDSLSAEFEPWKYRDEYRDSVLDLIERKAAGETFEQPVASTAAPQVVDLMAALEASVAAAKQARKRHPTAKTKPPVAALVQKPKRVRKTA
jgi:hypothetical protein